MGLMERPQVTVLQDGGKFWEHEYEKFILKAYVPESEIDGKVNNYTFRAPLLLIFEEEKMSMEEEVNFAKTAGFDIIASRVDAAVFFVYPTNEGGWEKADESMYQAIMDEVKMTPEYDDGLTEFTDRFKNEFVGYFVRGAKFRTDIYSYGKSADYVATKLLKTLNGEYLWGPGEITPAMCSMENLSVKPELERKDIAIISVNNSTEINACFDGCENLLIKDKADYLNDFDSFVYKFKMWCGKIEIEPNFSDYDMIEKRDFTEVKTSEDNRSEVKDQPTHKIGHMAYYNKDLFDKGPAPLLIGFHGGGDSSMYLTFVAGWWEIAHKYDFLFVSIENHQFVTPTEAITVIEDIKKKYNVDEKRIYATGFSMGSGKTWEMLQEYPSVFAGICPHSALFPMHNNPFGKSIDDGGFNTEISLPIFYSGGEKSFAPELPFQAQSALDRIQYLATVNKLKQKFDFTVEDIPNLPNKIWGANGERTEVLHDDTRDSNMTIQYFESEDGICRTALASIDNQMHECRPHSCETAWKFISKFSR
ncbi:MAG: hypothetical protein MJ172_08645 [Clostridia bacterium]|nr:hypothetical protein [Clostridia bacterium]